MSNEVQQKNSFGSTVAGYAAFPAIMTGGSALMAVKTHGKDVIKAQNNKAFGKLNSAIDADVFTRSEILAKSYDSYKDIAKASAKARKKYLKLSKRKHIPLFESFKNLFRDEANKVTLEKMQKAAFEASKKNDATLSNVKKLLNEAGENFNPKTAQALEESLNLSKIDSGLISNVAKKAVAEGAEATAKSGLKGFKNYVGKNFRNELGFKNGKFNYFMTAIQFVPKIFQEVIPTFKEKGIGEGFKELGKTLAQAGADLVGYATGGALGRAIGAAIGVIVCPAKGVGAKVGAVVGDMIGSMIVGTVTCKTVDKMIGKDESTNDLTSTQATEQKQAKNLDTTDAVAQTTVAAQTTNSISQQLTPEQARRIIEEQNQAKINKVYA